MDESPRALLVVLLLIAAIVLGRIYTRVATLGPKFGYLSLVSTLGLIALLF